MGSISISVLALRSNKKKLCCPVIQTRAAEKEAQMLPLCPISGWNKIGLSKLWISLIIFWSNSTNRKLIQLKIRPIENSTKHASTFFPPSDVFCRADLFPDFMHRRLDTKIPFRRSLELLRSQLELFMTRTWPYKNNSSLNLLHAGFKAFHLIGWFKPCDRFQPIRMPKLQRV